MSEELVQQILAGQRRSVAQAISLIENNGAEAQALLAALHPHTGRAHIVGVTGPPGSGKSTLVNALALHLRDQEAERPSRTVGIIAVDPTSPFSGGAILGDRIRMRDLAGDSGVFIRSMASRGNLGGLAWATADAAKVLDAAGFDVVVVETVGAGQAEVDIARMAHTTIVVEVPGLGDDIQAIKAGILEIADVFAVNKADLDGADHAVMALKMMLDLEAGDPHTMIHHGRLIQVAPRGRSSAGERATVAAWRPPIHKTVATRRDGIDALAQAIQSHWQYLQRSGGLAEREWERAARELEIILQQESLRLVLARTDPTLLTELIQQIVDRTMDPFTAAHRLLEP